MNRDDRGRIDPAGGTPIGRIDAGEPGRELTWYTHFDEWIVEKTLASHFHVFCDWHIHPNVVTALSLAAAAAIPWLHFRHAFGWVAASLVGRQILDCLDGEVARRCRKTSKFGARFDAAGDVLFFFVIMVLMVSYVVADPARVLLVSLAAFGVVFAVHVSICRGAGLFEHAVKTYDTPSLYQRSYAYLVNNSLVFSGATALIYILTVKTP